MLPAVLYLLAVPCTGVAGLKGSITAVARMTGTAFASGGNTHTNVCNKPAHIRLDVCLKLESSTSVV